MKLICSFLILNLAKSNVLTRIFFTGVHRTHRKAKRGSQGRKVGHSKLQYIIRDGGVSECIILHMSMRRGRYFMDAANWVFSKDAITN